jgi:hypothetical protein
VRSPTPLDRHVEQVCTPQSREYEQADDDQQDAHRAPGEPAKRVRPLAPAFAPGCDVGVDGLAERQVEKREHDRQQKTEDGPPARGLMSDRCGDFGQRPDRQDIGDHQDVPDPGDDIAQSVLRARGRCLLRRSASDQARDRLAALPNEPDQHDDEGECGQRAEQAREIGIETEAAKQLDREKCQDQEGEHADHPPMQEPGGGVVHRQQSQARRVRREQDAQDQRADADRDERGEVGEHGQPGRLMALPEHEKGADRGRNEHHNPEQLDQDAERQVAGRGGKALGMRCLHLALDVADQPPEQPLGGHADRDYERKAERDPGQNARAALADQALGEEAGHARQLGDRGQHPAPALAQRHASVSTIDIIMSCSDRGAGSDLPVELRQQQLACLAVAEVRQEVAQ